MNRRNFKTGIAYFRAVMREAEISSTDQLNIALDIMSDDQVTELAKQIRMDYLMKQRELANWNRMSREHYRQAQVKAARSVA